MADNSRVKTNEGITIASFNLFTPDGRETPLTALIVDKLAYPIIVGVDYLFSNQIDLILSEQIIFTRINGIKYTKEINVENTSGSDSNSIKTESNEEERIILIKKIKELELNHLNAAQQNKLKELLNNNWQAFASNPDAPRGTSELEMNIDTENSKPQGSKNRYITGAKRIALEETIQIWKDGGKIKPSRSAWNSQPLMVPKPGINKWRVCIDFRKLNSVTKPEDFPATHINDSLQKLANCDWYSSFDLASAYLQIPLSSESQEKTSFSTPFGKYEFLFVPFGLRNAPAVFNQYYSSVLDRVPKFKPAHFFDDTAPATKGSFEIHLEYLEGLFKTIIAAGLQFKLEKCEFATNKISFCGYNISKSGIESRSDKIQPIIDMEFPKNVKELRSFLGAMVYYLQFIPNYSTLAASLYALTRKNKRFVWTEEHSETFNTIKQFLIKAPILAHPNLDNIKQFPFRLTTDASEYGIGGVLEQKQIGGDWKPILYLSRSLRKGEKRYSATEREGLALYYCVKATEMYLQIGPCELRTDHKPLVYMLDSRKQNSRVNNWLLAISQIPFTASYIEGKSNELADVLSRLVKEVKPESDFIESESNRILNEVFEANVVTRQRKLNVEEKQDAELARAIADAEREDGFSAEPELQPINENSEDLIEQFDETISVEENGLPELEQLIKLQRSDSILGKLIEFAEPGKPITIELIKSNKENLKPELIKPACFILENNPNSIFTLRRDNVLVKLDAENNNPLIVIPEKLKNLVIAACHNNQLSGHQGVDRTLQRINSRCWWPFIRRDIDKFIQKCSVCTSTNIRGSTGTTENKTISYSTEPTECWHLDFIGPLPKSRRGGNKYVLVAIDEASGYIESRAMPECTTNGLKQAVRELINRWGIPKILRSDNGSVFTSGGWDKFANKQMGIELQYSPVYHPQSNGRVERANRTIKATLVKQCAASNIAIDWFDILTTTMHALNTSASAALGGEKSPFEIMHGRKARSILDIKWSEKDQPKRELDEWNWRTRESIQIAIKAMKSERTKAENKRIELNNDNNKRINIYQIGDRVLIKDSEPKTLTQKLVTGGHNNPFQSSQSNWKKGIILEKRGDGLVFDVELDKLNAKRRIRKEIIQVHADHLQFDNTV